MASFMGTGISEEELLRQQREAERLAREQAAAAEREAAEQTAKAQEEAQAATQAAQEQAEATAEAAQEAAQPVSSVSPDILAHAMQQVGNPIQEQKSAFEDISYEADFVKPGTMSATAGGVYKVDPVTGKAGFDFSDLHGKDEQWLLKNRSSVAGNPQMLRAYDDYIDQRRSDGLVNSQNMGFLSGIGLMDVNGADIDIGAASPQMVVQGIGGIADTAKRKEAAKAFTALTQTPGSRFYGFNVDEDALGTYRDSASMTQAAYNEAVKAYKSKFWASSGHEEQNNLLYRSEYQRIQNNPNYDEYAKRLLTQTLNEIYTGITQGEVPDVNTPQSENDKIIAENAAMEMDIAQGEKPDLKAAMEAIPDTPQEVAERLAQMEAPARMEEIPSEPKQPERTPAAQSSGAAQEIFMQEALKGVPAVTAPQGEKQGVDSSAAYDIFADRATAGLEIPGAAQMQEEAPLKIENMADAYDAYKMGKSYLLGEEDRKYLEELLNDPGVKRLNGQLDADAMKALNVGNESPEYLMTRNLSALGTTVYNAWQDIHSDDFPPELRTNAEMIVMETVRDAGKAVERGMVVSDHGKNQIETYLDTVEGARDGINTIYADWQSLTQNKLDLDADLAAVNEKAIENAKIAVREGYDSPQQYALVLENSDVKPAQVYEAMQAYPLYEEIAYIYSDYFTDGGGFDNSPIKARLNASGVTNDDQYRFALRDGMNALYEEDVKMALTLGLSIEDYYASMGGMSADQLAQRANVRMQQQGASITQEERDALSVQPFGEGVGAAATVGTSAKRGWDSFQLGFLDTLYMGKNALAVRNTAAKMTGYYQGQFGIYGRDYYRSDMLKLADSGSLDERYAQAIRDALDSGEDIYSIGIDPRDMGGLLSKAGDIRKNIAQYDNMMRTRGTEGEYFWYNMLASTVENGAMMAASTLGGATLGSAAAGFAVGYGVPNFSQRYNERLDQGYKLNTASALAALDTTGMIAANVGTFTRGFGQLTGAGSLEKAGYMAARMNNASGLAKGMAAIRTFGGAAIKNTAEEAIKDPFVEGMTQRFIDTAFAPLYQKVDAGEDVSASDVVTSLTAALSPMNVLRAAEETAEETVKNAPEEALYSLIFTLAGAGGETYHSVRMARDVVSGRSGDVQGVIDAAAEDLKTPEFAEYLNEKAKQNQIDEATTVAMMTGAGDESFEGWKSEGRKYLVHERKRVEAAMANEAARQSYAENIEEYLEAHDESILKDLDELLVEIKSSETKAKENAGAAYKADQKAQDHAQKWIEECRKRGVMELAHAADNLRAHIQGDTETRKRTLDTELADIDEQIASMQESIAEADDMGDMAALDDLLARQGELMIRRDELLEGAQNEEDFQDARGAAESALNEQDKLAAEALQQSAERERLAQEKADMAPVYKDLRSRLIYVDDQQAANIKSATGLTIPQFNRKYGFSLTQNKAKSRNALDGSFFADLAQQAPGYIDADTAHPEEAIVALAERKKILSGVQAAVGSVDAEAYLTETTYGTQDPITQKTASDLYRNTGVKLVTANLADGTRGWFDRTNGQLVLSNKLGAGEIRRAAAMHELTHFIERSSGYEAYKQAVLEAAYAGGEGYREQMLERDREDIREEYEAHGVTLSDSDLDAELVAAATEKVIEGSESFFEKLINGGKTSFVRRAYMKVKGFLSRLKAKKASPEALAQYDAIQKAHDLMQKALATSPKWAEGQKGSDPTVELSEASRDMDNRPVEQTRMQYAFGRRQFGESLQHADFIEDRVKEIVEGTEYERDTNREQVRRAMNTLDRDGVEAAAVRLMSKEKAAYTADDNALAFVTMAQATQNGDNVTAAMLAMRMLEESSEQGRALQSLGIVNRMTPEGALGETLRKANEYNAKSRNIAPGLIPVGSEAPKRATQTTTGGNEPTAAKSVMKAEKQPASSYAAAGGAAPDSGVSGQLASSYAAASGAMAGNAYLGGTRLKAKDDPSVGWTGEEAAPDGTALQETMLDSREGWMPDEAFDGPELAADAEGEQERIGPPPVVDTGTVHHVPNFVQEIYNAADVVNEKLSAIEEGTNRDNPWGLPMNGAQMELVREYGLMGTTLPTDYAHATVKQRMLAAIISTPDNVRGERLLTLCQQLEFMKRGYAVVTEADLNFIAGQMSEALLNGVENGSGVTRDAQIALARTFDAQANITPVSLPEQFRTATFVNMLSAPSTWARNIVSNVLMNPLEAASALIATKADEQIAKKTGERTTDVTTAAERAASKKAFGEEVANTFEDYFITHADTSHGRKYEFDRGGRGRTFDQNGLPEWMNNMLEAGKNVVDFAMQIGDRPFFEKCYSEELAVLRRLAENGQHKMSEKEMKAEANQRALERVFQEDSKIAAWIAQGQRIPYFGTVLNMIVPFVKTPTNIAARLMQYSPVGLAKAIFKDGVWDMQMNNASGFDQRKFVMNLGRGLTGTGLTVAGYLLANANILRPGYGEEENQKRRDILKALGEPYGTYIQIGDTKREIEWALPGSGALNIGVKLAQNLKAATNSEEAASAMTLGILSSTWDEVFNASMLSAFNDAFSGYGDATEKRKKFLEAAGTSFLSRLTPSAMRSTMKATDPYIRDTSSSSPVWAALNQTLVQCWPIARQALPIKTDLTGDQQVQSGYWNPKGEHGSSVMNFVDTFLTPTATVGEKNDSALMELLDLSYRTGKSAFLPANLLAANAYTLNLTKTQAKNMGYGDAAITMNLTDEEKREANAAYGSLLFNGDGGRYYLDTKGNIQMVTGLRRIMDSPEWAAMTDEERTKRVSDEIKVAKDLIIADIARRKREEGEI